MENAFVPYTIGTVAFPFKDAFLFGEVYNKTNRNRNTGGKVEEK